jgi:superfamily II DNA/RNA helicase
LIKSQLLYILDPEEYIHRVGRTARGADGKGKALLILLKYEIGLVRYLRAAKVFIIYFYFLFKLKNFIQFIS